MSSVPNNTATKNGTADDGDGASTFSGSTLSSAKSFLKGRFSSSSSSKKDKNKDKDLKIDHVQRYEMVAKKIW